MRYILILFSITLLFYSCDTLVNTDFPEPDKKLVVLSLFSPDSVMKIRLSTVVDLNTPQKPDSVFNWVNGAICSLYVENSFLEVLQDTGQGIYVSPSGYHPLTGKHYTIRVFHNNYPSVEATSYVPDSVPIVSVEKKDSALVESDGFSQMVLNLVKVRINNTLDSMQFMELFLTQASPHNESWDTVKYDYLFMKYPGVILRSGVKTFKSILFSSDNLAPGPNLLTVYYITPQIWSDHGLVFYKNLQTHLRVVSLDYYYYKLTSIMEDNYDDFWNGTYRPTPIYSNVKGGYGIFAGYVEAVDSTSYPLSLDSSQIKIF